MLRTTLSHSRRKGFKKAKKSVSGCLGFVTWSAKNGTIDVESRQLACLQCSQNIARRVHGLCHHPWPANFDEKSRPRRGTERHRGESLEAVNGMNKYTNFGFCSAENLVVVAPTLQMWSGSLDTFPHTSLR